MEMKEQIAKNISDCRKKLKLTQYELAEKLNYTDKAVSKWERGECVPDVFVLKKMADLFGLTLDELVSEPKKKIKLKPALKDLFVRYTKLLITLASVIAVWIVAVCIYVFPAMFGVYSKTWLVFVAAVPISCIVCLVFSCIWGKIWTRCLFASLLTWTTATTLFLIYCNQPKTWLLFLICIPVQALLILIFAIMHIKNANRAKYLKSVNEINDSANTINSDAQDNKEKNLNGDIK